jgi:hypothetical protein
MYWDIYFLLPSIRAFPFLGSDHTPLLIDYGSNKVVVKKLFCLEKWWLSQPDFAPLVEKCGNTLAPFLSLKMSINYICNEIFVLNKKEKIFKEYDKFEIYFEQNKLSPL